jgi:hypothetical protein
MIPNPPAHIFYSFLTIFSLRVQEFLEICTKFCLLSTS